MLRIARWTVAHRRVVVVAWIVAAVGVLAISSSVGKQNASNFTLPGTGSQHAVDLLSSRFPAQAGDADQIVFQARTGTLHDAADRAAIATTVARVADLPHVTGVVSPYAAGAHSISRDGTIAFATVNFDKPAGALPKAAVDTRHQDGRVGAIEDPAGGARRPGDRAGPAGLARVRDDRGHRRGDLDPSAQLRVVQRDGSADCDRAGWPRYWRRGDHAGQPHRGDAGLRFGAGLDDRPGSRRRLCAVHRHTLPRELPAKRRRRADGDRGGDDHVGSLGRVRRRHGRDCSAGHVRPRRERAQRRGRGRGDRSAAGPLCITDALARAAQLCRSPGRRGPRTELGAGDPCGQARLLAAVGASGAAAPGAHRGRRHRADARYRGPGARPAPCLQRRRQRPGQPDDAPGVRPAGQRALALGPTDPSRSRWRFRRLTTQRHSRS